MAIETFSVLHTLGKTVYAYIMRSSDGFILGSADNVFAANVAAADTPKHAATERTDLGDATDSLYTVNLELANLNTDPQPLEFVLQFRDDLGTDEIIDTTAFRVAAGNMNARRAIV